MRMIIFILALNLIQPITASYVPTAANNVYDYEMPETELQQYLEHITQYEKKYFFKEHVEEEASLCNVMSQRELYFSKGLKALFNNKIISLQSTKTLEGAQVKLIGKHEDDINPVYKLITTLPKGDKTPDSEKVPTTLITHFWVKDDAFFCKAQTRAISTSQELCENLKTKSLPLHASLALTPIVQLQKFIKEEQALVAHFKHMLENNKDVALAIKEKKPYEFGSILFVDGDAQRIVITAKTRAMMRRNELICNDGEVNITTKHALVVDLLSKK